MIGEKEEVVLTVGVVICGISGVEGLDAGFTRDSVVWFFLGVAVVVLVWMGLTGCIVMQFILFLLIVVIVLLLSRVKELYSMSSSCNIVFHGLCPLFILSFVFIEPSALSNGYFIHTWKFLELISLHLYS